MDDMWRSDSCFFERMYPQISQGESILERQSSKNRKTCHVSRQAVTGVPTRQRNRLSATDSSAPASMQSSDGTTLADAAEAPRGLHLSKT